MCNSCKHMRSFSGIQLLLSILFVLQIALSPLAYSNVTGSSDRSMGSPVSKHQEAYIINDIVMNEVLNIISINRIMNKYSGSVQQIISRLQEVWMSLIVMFGILLVYTVAYFRVLKQQKSILSTSLGGHAPPAEIISHI